MFFHKYDIQQNKNNNKKKFLTVFTKQNTWKLIHVNQDLRYLFTNWLESKNL